MWLSRRDVEMAERYRDMVFRLYGREGGALVEGIENFKYLGRSMKK